MAEKFFRHRLSDVDWHEEQSSVPEPEEIIVIEMSEVCIMTSQFAPSKVDKIKDTHCQNKD